MAVTTVKTSVIPSHPALQENKLTSITDVQSISSLSDLTNKDQQDQDIPIPPELPLLHQQSHISLPQTMDGFSPEMQANITAYIEKHYPDATTEVEIETILDILLHVVGETYTGSASAGETLSRVIHSSNAARQIGSLAWKYLPQAKKHQVYGAMASRYDEAAQLANSLKTSHQKTIDEYAVLLTQPQIDAVRRDIRSWEQVGEACEVFERAADRDA